jgi:ankyrin repeat protein
MLTNQQGERLPGKRRSAMPVSGFVGLSLLVLFVASFFLVASFPGGEYLMWRAAVTGNSSFARILVMNRRIVNSRDEGGWSPLMIAAAWGHTATVQEFLDRGAELNFQDRFGFTALARASHRGYADVVTLLLRQGADPNLVDQEGNTALILAVSHGTLGNAEWTLEARAGGANWGHIEPKRGKYNPIIANLILHGADWNLRNHAGKCALDIARERGDTNTVASLTLLGTGENPWAGQK